MGIIDFDKEEGKPDASSLLSKWAAGQGATGPKVDTVSGAAVDPKPDVSPAPTGFASIFSSGNAPGVNGANSKNKKNQLTPEQAAKLASGLKKIVTNINVIIVGAGVQMFGKVPAQLDDEEIALLQMGWEMYIDEIFAKAKIKPWHVLLAGNVMIAATMYVGGTPIKKQLPAGADKAKSATVTPIDGGKKDA